MAESSSTGITNLPEVYALRDLVGHPFGQTFLSQAVKSGRLPAKRTGRYVLVAADDWANFLNSFPSAAAGRAHRQGGAS